ncbi:CU044_2847 family protein [Streptomyces sp. NPDC001795]|uniref:CU044_2847 family protein n=1 Tax=unclassified Streptomyces TaxID=2593676 RepID=UPI003328CD7F
MERKIQEIELPGGEKMLARVSVLESQEMPGADEFAYEDVGALDHMTARIDRLNELVRGVGGAVLEAARSVGPDEVSATFGVELALKPGKAVALLADGEAKAALSITLTWRGNAAGRGTGAQPGPPSAVTALPAARNADDTGDTPGRDSASA